MLLALDLGTTNVKAMVTDLAGRPLTVHSCPLHLFHVEDGGVEQDIEEIWRATLTVIQQTARAVNASGVLAIGVSSQGGAMQVLDGHGRPSGRVISWLDQRGRAFDDALTAELGRGWLLQRIAHGRSALAIGQILRLGHERPREMHLPNRIGFVGDVIVSRLCGRAAQDGTSAALTLLYDPARRNYAPDVLRRLGVVEEQLPALLAPQQAAGGLLPQVAGQTGLRAGMPVSAAVHDQYASALGTGAVRARTVMLGTGTAWVLLAVTDHAPRPVHDDALNCHHVCEGLWGQIISMVNGGSALTWALELTGLASRSANEIDALLESSAAGSGGLMFWPFMAAGGAAGLPHDTRARMSGLQAPHGAAHFIRAVVEGLAYELNRHLDLLGSAGQHIEQLAMGGGAGASRVTPQIIADVTGLPLRCFGGSNSSLLGAAILARGLLERGGSLADLAEAMLPSASQFNPGEEAHAYQERYRQYLCSLPRRGGGQS